MYDDLDHEDMDLQDKYFDEEDEDVKTGANGTGVYDYWSSRAQHAIFENSLLTLAWNFRLS